MGDAPEIDFTPSLRRRLSEAARKLRKSLDAIERAASAAHPYLVNEATNALAFGAEKLDGMTANIREINDRIARDTAKAAELDGLELLGGN